MIGDKLLIEHLKKCYICKEFKPLKHFHNWKGDKYGKAPGCKVCANNKARENHRIRSEDQDWLDKKRKAGRDLTRTRKRMAVEYKGGVCERCNKTYPDYVYDFHHLSGDTKLDNPSAKIKGSWDVAKQELDKCIMVCANCHRELHYAR